MTKSDKIKLLNDVFGNFQQITQWLPNEIDLANHYHSKCSAIIETLEQEIFGVYRTKFKRGYEPKYESCGYTLFDRFYFIVKEDRYDIYIKKLCYFDVEKMYQYFKKLSKLRESFNK